MDFVSLFQLKELFTFLKSTPAILGIIITNLIAFFLFILGRLKRVLKTSKNIFYFSLGISFLLNTIIFFVLYKFSLLPQGADQKIINFITLFLLQLSIIYIAIYLTEDKTAMGKHSNSIDQDMPEKDFLSRVERVTKALNYNLSLIDNATNWSTLDFVSLDAEVELRREGKEKTKKVTDLLKAIKSNKDERLFLVIGDPGSGKSVALRKLCQDLQNEVKRTGKIPVYINLKEWQQKWNRHNLPTVDQLKEFVFSNLKRRDTVTTEFFTKYFDKLHEQGRLYYVFDSFDEIPSVLGEVENSILIKSLSSVMYDFLVGARQESQGILASRIFRRPTEEFKTNTILEIRPFSEHKIDLTFNKMLGYSEDVVRQLFRERPDLLSAASNPFTASLLARYARDHHNQLPANVVNLYENYFDGAFSTASEIIKGHGLTVEYVEEAAVHMATVMFSEQGLEVNMSSLKEKINPKYRLKVDEVVDVLQFSRIGRRSAETGLFSFSHRRFCEYFVVKKMALGEADLPLGDIPKDSQWRDALVMYCQVATEDRAVQIANYCWEVIKTQKNPQSTEAIHCMRFLRDAFRTRLSALDLIKPELTEYIIDQIVDGSNMITAKLAIECLGLLDEIWIDKGAIEAIETKNIWLIEATTKACRTLSTISDELKGQMIYAIRKFDLKYNIWIENDLLFSLSLSPAFKDVKKHYRLYVADFWITIFFSLIYPLFFSLYILLNISPFYNTHNINTISSFFTTNSSFTPSNLIFTLLIFYSILIFAIILLDSLNDNLFSEKIRTKLILYGCAYCIYISIFTILGDNSYLYYILFTILIFLLAIFTHSLIMKVNLFRGIFSPIKIDKYSIYIFAISIVIILIIYMVTQLPGNWPQYIKNVFLIFMSSLWCLSIIAIMAKTIKLYIHLTDVINKVNINQCNDRVYIYSILYKICLTCPIRWNSVFSYNIHDPKIRQGALELLSPFLCNYFLTKFINYLESNITKVIGSWPDTKIFMSTINSKQMERLAKLEEKWSGLNR